MILMIIRDHIANKVERFYCTLKVLLWYQDGTLRVMLLNCIEFFKITNPVLEQDSTRVFTQPFVEVSGVKVKHRYL